jgi:hypothetical protein
VALARDLRKHGLPGLPPSLSGSESAADTRAGPGPGAPGRLILLAANVSEH